MTSQNPTSWSEQLLWVEYAHNTLTSSATGLSPFECTYGFQPPLFPALEKEASCPSVQDFIRRCRRTWTRARAALLQAADRYTTASNRHRSKALPVSHTSSSGQLSTPVTALAAFKPAPVSASVPDCSCAMPDFPACFPGLITCCRPRLSPTCLPHLCPGYYLSLLFSTTSFAYSLLVTHLLGSVATQLIPSACAAFGSSPYP